MKIVSKYKYKYCIDYSIPSGDYWNIYRIWFGFIPIKTHEIKYNGMTDIPRLEEFIK